MTPKEQLSLHVEEIFKKYTTPGLHICDIATGGGKSYTIGKLTCEYYPEHFERIVILCVQNKLTLGMKREIDRSIQNANSLIKENDILVIENNSEVIKKAIKSGAFKSLVETMEYQVGELKKQNNGINLNHLQAAFRRVNNIYKGVQRIVEILNDDNNEYMQAQLDENEANLRKAVRTFFEAFSNHLERIKPNTKVTHKKILHLFKDLKIVYPQVEYKDKKVLLMTVHKSMYGIDPILDDKISLQDFSGKKKTLLIFDESDQAAVAIRNTIIDQAVQGPYSNKRYAKGYNAMLQYRHLLDTPERLDIEYYGDTLEQNITKAKQIAQSKWEKVFKDTEPYHSIFLNKEVDLETYRRGVFMSGNALRLTIAAAPKEGERTKSYVCYKKGQRHLTLEHEIDDNTLRDEYDYVVPIDDFLTLVSSTSNVIKAQLNNVVRQAYENSKTKFDEAIKDVRENPAEHRYVSYPTIEREIHTLLSRFETPNEYQIEQQLLDFMTTRKNIVLRDGDKKLKLPDYSVYTQGVQFYQEEIDEKDNLHRVRISCRELSTTPEKILVDLVNKNNTSVVLCSATASSMSVVSNYDMEYLQHVLGDKLHPLSSNSWQRFDKLVSDTYPQEHHVEIIPITHFEFPDKRENKLSLPEQYKRLFSESALQEGLPDKWFSITLRIFKSSGFTIDDISFRFYRLFQFIEAYHWFITNEAHSMIFFQNRTGDKDLNQFNVLSCLIDGSYTGLSVMGNELPTDWKNNNIRTSRDWEEVEGTILRELSESPDAKIMLISAYNSYKAGANLQYEIPDGLDYIAGDNWQTNDALKKDWDAVYLQMPTAYLMLNEDGYESTYERSLHLTMLTLMMLYERGCLSRSDVAQWLHQALSNTFYFGDTKNPGILHDKAAWMQTIIEQAIGRLCRTRNKPRTTHILYDESITPYFDQINLDKSLTVEFRTLSNYIKNHPIQSSEEANTDEIIRCNLANSAKRLLDMNRRRALRYLPKPDDIDDMDEEYYDESDEVSYHVQVAQKMNESYKRTIIRKPVINSLEDITEEDKHITFISKCYGDWPRDEKGTYVCYFNSRTKNICPQGDKDAKVYPKPISTAMVRLDTLMKNHEIRSYFEEQGYATEWRQDGLILHPEILATDYAGEIGEEAFRAVLIRYLHIPAEKICHLEGKEYEYADFIYTRDDGKRIAFDVKNMVSNHADNGKDLSTTEKRQKKEQTLGCPIVTVNIVKLPDGTMDATREIVGVINNDGQILPDALEQIRKYLFE